MRKALVAGNWKMHGRLNQNSDLISNLVKHLQPLASSIDIAVCPPLIYLHQVSGLLASSGIALGAQDLSRFADDGAHTGEASAAMLSDMAVSYVLIGHSERRSEQQESNQQIAVKIRNALAARVTPILCVGESLVEREAGQEEVVIAQQLSQALQSLESAKLDTLVIAYEPVWAIGTGKTATPEQAQRVHRFMRQYLAQNHSKALADKITLIYGGSVKASNAEQLFNQPDIDGGLIGGAALIPEEFIAICRAAAASQELS